MNDAAKQIMYWRPFLAGGPLKQKGYGHLGVPSKHATSQSTKTPAA